MKEQNLMKKPWRDDHLKIALVYPNSYSSMAGLTIQTLYSLWNRYPNVICERFFLPLNDSPLRINKFKSRGNKSSNLIFNPIGNKNPILRSIENQMPLTSFDIIAFTISYELDYKNLFWFLDNANIPFLKRERFLYPNPLISGVIDPEKKLIMENESDYPIIIAGGPVIRSNPLPLERIIEGFFIGEFEPAIENFINGWFHSSNNIKNLNYRDIQLEFLTLLNKIPGFWIPAKNINGQKINTITRVHVKDLNEIEHPINQILQKFDTHEKNIMPFGEAIFIEVNRGCPHFCKFCLTGATLKPFRNRKLVKLQQIILESTKLSKINKIVLIGSSVTDHPYFVELCKYLNNNQIQFSIPSIRIDTLTSEMAKLIKIGGMKTVAIAPETGSDRLRLLMNKKITNSQIIEGCKLLLDTGIPNIKLYLLYGLPHENIEDIKAIPQLVKEIASLGYGKNAVKLSINPFIPKAHTPFQFNFEHYLEPKMELLKKRYQQITKSLIGNKQVKIETLSLEEAYIQTILALGDSNFTDFIINAYENTMSIKKWYKNITSEKEIWKSKIFDYLSILQISKFEEAPWNFIDHKINSNFLKKLYSNENLS